VAGWRNVTEAVHQAGGRIFAQIWHAGRASHPSVQPNEAAPVAPSALAANGQIYTPQGPQPYPVPRALTQEEIPEIISDFARATSRAIEAGFDGVELHGANGYLIEGFLYSGSNKREDEYGGSLEKRAQFLLETVTAVTKAIGAERVGVRLSPQNRLMGMETEKRSETFAFVVDQLNPFGLAYLHVLELPAGHPFLPPDEPVPEPMTPSLRKRFTGPLVVNGGYDLERGQDIVQTGGADLVAFGLPFIANPDLVSRFKQGAPLNMPNPETFYGGNDKGYTDYPYLEKDIASS
ncbi:MAG: alkene reductase, partial [Deinococcota bacterium]